METGLYVHHRCALACAIGFCMSTAAAQAAMTETILHNFSYSAGAPGNADGIAPTAPPVLDAAGNIYGTTSLGGPNSGGVVYKIAPGGAETVLHAFGGTGDGNLAFGAVTLDRQGNLYGTAAQGGAFHDGIVFKITVGGQYSILHSFNDTDGNYPWGQPAIDAHGNLFGTTLRGGTSGKGTIFEIAADGTFTSLYSFSGPDGYLPQAGPTLGDDGTIYGTTQGGGDFSKGVAFKLPPGGTLTVLHSFNGTTDGLLPLTPVILDSATGALYGTTDSGGTGGDGTVYRLDSDGTYTVLHSFHRGGQGAEPGGLVRSKTGVLYGTTYQAFGPAVDGTIFKLAPNGTFTILHRFTGSPDGANPAPGLAIVGGVFYGATHGGGTTNQGTVFSLSAH